MTTRAWLGCLCLALAGASGAALGQEAPPGGAERPLSHADLRELPPHVSGLLVLGRPADASAGSLIPLDGSAVRVSELPTPSRVPVLYFAFDAGHPLQAQLQRALRTAAGWGDKDELVLTVHRCAASEGDAEAEAAARRRAETVARAFQARGFRTEVRSGDQSTYCLVLPRRARGARNPLGVTLERVP